MEKKTAKKNNKKSKNNSVVRDTKFIKKILAIINSKYFILVTIISTVLAIIASFIPNVNAITYPFAIISVLTAAINFIKEKERFKSFRFTISLVAVFVCVFAFFFAIMSNFSMLGSFSRFMNSVIGNNVAPIEIIIKDSKYFGETITFEDKMTLAVKRDETFEPSKNATFLTGNYLNADNEEYECRKYKISIKNNSYYNYNLSYFTASLLSGDQPAERIFDPENSINFNNQVVKINSKVTFFIAFYEKKSSKQELTIKISPTQFSTDNVIYSNKPAKSKNTSSKDEKK